MPVQFKTEISLPTQAGSYDIDPLPLQIGPIANTGLTEDGAGNIGVVAGGNQVAVFQTSGNLSIENGIDLPWSNGGILSSGAGTVVERTITGTTNEIAVANGTGVSGNPTISLPATLALEGKTVSVGDANFSIKDTASPTKVLKIETGNITAGQTRTLTAPDASGTIALVSDLTSGYQPLDSDLTAIAALAGNGYLYRNAGAFSTHQISTTDGIGSSLVGSTLTFSLASTLDLTAKSTSVGDANFYIKDTTDATKIAKFEAGSIATSTTRTYTLPNANGTLALTSDIGTPTVWASLVSTTDFATTAASTSTITMNTDQTANIKAGDGVRFTLSGVTYYAQVSAITSTLLTIRGAPLTTTASALTALAYANSRDVVVTRTDRILGSLITGDNQGDPSIRWDGRTGYLVKATAKLITAATGADLRVAFGVGAAGNDLCSSPGYLALTAGSTSEFDTGVNINTTNYSIDPGEYLFLNIDQIGSTVPGSGLLINYVFIKP